jgi:hypothetical protein
LDFTLLGEPEPIAGARVRWRPFGTTTTANATWTEGSTDDHGYFGVADIATGQWEVEICADGYRPMHVTVQIDPLKPARFDVLTAIRKTLPAADRVRVMEPSSVVRVDVGTPVHVKWRIENGPIDPKGWEVRVSISGCGEGIGSLVIHAEPLTNAEGGFTWHGTKQVVDWITSSDDWIEGGGLETENDQGEVQLPVEVCIYNAAGRNEHPGVLQHDDELLLMSETCHAAADQSWLFCGTTADDGGIGRLAPPSRRPEEARKRYEAAHSGVLQVAGQVTPPNLIDRVEPDWKDRGSHQPVVLEAVITTKGLVFDPIIVSAERPTVGRDALAALQRWKYEPATLDGKPVAVFVTVVFTP